MAVLYEKKPIELINEFGIEEITDENIFKKGPSVIVILAMTWFLSNVNGAMRLVANLVNPDIDNTYNPNKRIFGLGFGNYTEEYEGFTAFTPEDDELEKFVAKYFLPLVTSNGMRIELLDAMKNVRNINVITYCAATQYFKTIENIFERKMQELAYPKEEIKMILSQICLASVSGNALKHEQAKATTMVFGDINDKYFELPFKSIEGIENYALIDYQNQFYFIFNGNGGHDFTEYMQKDKLISEAIKLFINDALDSSICNCNHDACIPLDIDSISRDILEKLNKDGKHLILKKTI